MPIERYFYSGSLETGKTIFLKQDEHHHLARVIRGRPGETVEVINGEGALAFATIESIEKRHTALSLANVISEPPPPYSLLLYQGIPRLNRLETIVEKCTELGVTEFILFPSERSEKKLFSDNQNERLKAITIAAVKQSGRLFLPKITLASSIKLWKDLKEEWLGFYGDIRPVAPWLSDVLHNIKKTKHFAFCIGPESGFTPEETILLEHKGFSGVKLHKNILRTDTAAIAALSIAHYLMH